MEIPLCLGSLVENFIHEKKFDIYLRIVYVACQNLYAQSLSFNDNSFFLIF